MATLVACTASGTDVAGPRLTLPSSGTTIGTALPATRSGTVGTGDFPAQLSVLKHGQLPRSTSCAPAPQRSADLPIHRVPGAVLPPGAVLGGSPDLRATRTGGWFVVGGQVEHLGDAPDSMEATALRMPDGCGLTDSFMSGSTLVLSVCDGSTSPKICSVYGLDTTTGRVATGYGLPAGSEALYRPSSRIGPAIVVLSPTTPDPTDPKVQVVTADATTGAWQALQPPCAGWAGGIHVAADDRTDLVFSCGADRLTTAHYSPEEPFALRSVETPSGTDPAANVMCHGPDVVIGATTEPSAWFVQDGEGNELATTSMPFMVTAGCAVDGDVVALSYSSPGGATVELRHIEDLTVLDGVTWPSEAASRNPVPTAPSVIGLDGRRVWLLVQDNLASLDL